jgi:hypothetical protein
MSLFHPETMITATESSPSSNLSSAHHTLPHPSSTTNLELEELVFAVTQEGTHDTTEDLYTTLFCAY